jgi:glycosyltransferase involved in cell wall biosynthesis
MTRTGAWRRVLEFAERASASLSTRAFCVSESLRREVVDLQLCPSAKVSVVGYGSCAGVDVQRFRPAQDSQAKRTQVRAAHGIPQDAILVTFVGRVAKDKGFCVLAEAWTKVARQRTDLCLLVAGEEDATDPVPREVLERLRECPSVFWAGSVPYGEV